MFYLARYGYNDEEGMLNFFVKDLEDTLDNIQGNNKQERVVYFTKWILNLHDNGYTYLEAIVNFCDSHDIDYEDSAKLISHDLKSKMYEEALQLNQLKSDDAFTFNF